jgi:hypothetical protein
VPAQGPAPISPPENRETVVNLSEVLLEKVACLALSKALNYAVTQAVVPVEDILCGMEKVTTVLPVETAEKVQQETVSILKGSCKPKDNLTSAERMALQTLKANEALTILPTDTGNVTVVLVPAK